MWYPCRSRLHSLQVLYSILSYTLRLNNNKLKWSISLTLCFQLENKWLQDPYHIWVQVPIRTQVQFWRIVKSWFYLYPKYTLEIMYSTVRRSLWEHKSRQNEPDPGPRSGWRARIPESTVKLSGLWNPSYKHPMFTLVGQFLLKNAVKTLVDLRDPLHEHVWEIINKFKWRFLRSS